MPDDIESDSRMPAPTLLPLEILGMRLLPVLVAAIATMVIGCLWYSPILFARPSMLAMGYDPNHKSKLDEMRQGAGKTYAIAFSWLPACWPKLLSSPPNREQRPLWHESRLRDLAGICHYHPIDDSAVRKEADQAVLD